MLEMDQGSAAVLDEAASVLSLLEAIDRLLDALDSFDAPITREILGSAMMALVHECGLQRPAGALN